ncbi:MAG: glycosyltransferase, partial [Candidatus Wenzhouxiangella sp. M2_3B_020]
DFGIVPVEAFASGTPVLGIRDGYTQHQITDGWNGLLFSRGEPDDVAGAVERFETHGVAASSRELTEFAEQFSVDAFERRMRDAVARAKANSEVSGVADRVGESVVIE